MTDDRGCNQGGRLERFRRSKGDRNIGGGTAYYPVSGFPLIAVFGQATARGGEFRRHVRKGRTVTGGAGRKGQAPGGGSRRGASSRARLFQRLRRLSRSMTSGWAPRCSASARTRCRPGWACSRAGSTWLRRSATKEAAREGVGCQRSRREPASLTERIISWSRRNLSPWLTDPLLMPRRP